MSWTTKDRYSHGRLGRPRTATDRRFAAEGLLLAVVLAALVAWALTGGAA